MDQISAYASAFGFKLPVHYSHMSGSPARTRKDEIVLDTDMLVTCPSIKDLTRAIEKRTNRSDAMRIESNIVPLCMVLLTSKSYCINSKSIDNVSDSLIERCWECLETISHSSSKALQDWLTYAIGTRSPVGYSILYCQHKSSAITIRNIPYELPRSMRFKLISPSTIGIPEHVWHRQDMIEQTMLSHINAVMFNISSNSKRIDKE